MSDRNLSVWSEYGCSKYALKEWGAQSELGRKLFEFAALRVSDWGALTKNWYLRATYSCNALRLLEGFDVSLALWDHHRSSVQDARIYDNGDESRLLSSYLGSRIAQRKRQLYLRHGSAMAARMKFPRDPDNVERQGNLLVLKRFDEKTGEKGILYLQYTESILSFVALFNLEAVSKRYRLVLEPSTWGYQDAAFLLLMRSGFDVIVQAQDQVDYDYILSLRSNLLPIRIGAGDWIDPENFSVGEEPKIFDFVMVASWSPVKRHSLFFSSLAMAGLQNARIALIGYPWEGRTKQDIEKSAASFGIQNIQIFEKIPRQQVASIIRSSKVGVMLSRREGANRGVYECFFCDVPVVLSKLNRGFNRNHINESTGRLADDADLGDVLRCTLSKFDSFAPRAWAEQNTGYRRASQTLDEYLRELADRRGEPYSTSIAITRSVPAAAYVNNEDRVELQSEQNQLGAFLRNTRGRG